MIFNLILGIAVLMLAGDSCGQVFRSDHPMIRVAVIGTLEMIAGVYFTIAAIGACAA